jgi:pilus assembly protein Flp/PilA
LQEVWTDPGGASASEYALILAIIGGAIALAALALGTSIGDSMEKATTEIGSGGGGS